MTKLEYFQTELEPKFNELIALAVTGGINLAAVLELDTDEEGFHTANIISVNQDTGGDITPALERVIFAIASFDDKLAEVLMATPTGAE